MSPSIPDAPPLISDEEIEEMRRLQMAKYRGGGLSSTILSGGGNFTGSSLATPLLGTAASIAGGMG